MERIYLKRGDIALCPTAAEVTTVLGSCVSVCLWDRRLRIGGMNHFKSPSSPPAQKPSNSYGDMAMKTLIQGMIELGSRKSDLRAIIIGGGSVIDEPMVWLNIGRDNIRFARMALDRDAVTIQSTHTGGDFGRKVVFNTSKGTAIIKRVNSLKSTGKKEQQ